ncbi:Nicotinamidase-related amidase [Marininema mesophilum]|uniref:Nicotinamidase-related amidase n=1 Tax=Marininema mesophilum TaxID=1048340 RepID=A0A1H2XBT0_9BACL|nr:isochorismatase family cysteine hydrolase [Marininema mesophilum]SDW90206.1 Nicotinamidase-related amidase [Marininema mesophilum]
MKIGFLIIDMQRAFLQDQMKELNVEGACEYINYVADLLRSSGHHIIHIQDIEGKDETPAELLDIIPEINVDEKDTRITKIHSNAFWNTELEHILKNSGVDLVVVSGFAAEHCVLFTYNGALERGFKSVILQNGILSTNIDNISLTYRDRKIISYPVIESIIHI